MRNIIITLIQNNRLTLVNMNEKLKHIQFPNNANIS